MGFIHKTSMAKKGAKSWRKQEKVVTRSQSVSSQGSISMHLDLENKDYLDSEVSDVSSGRVKSVTKVPQHR